MTQSPNPISVPRQSSPIIGSWVCKVLVGFCRAMWELAPHHLNQNVHLHGSSEKPQTHGCVRVPTPGPLRMSNSRSSTDGEVVGNHVFWGANAFRPQLQDHIFLTAALPSPSSVSATFQTVSCAPRVLSGWKRGIAGAQAQPQG